MVSHLIFAFKDLTNMNPFIKGMASLGCFCIYEIYMFITKTGYVIWTCLIPFEDDLKPVCQKYRHAKMYHLTSRI